jgi:hypothetical protein
MQMRPIQTGHQGHHGVLGLMNGRGGWMRGLEECGVWNNLLSTPHLQDQHYAKERQEISLNPTQPNNHVIRQPL